MKKDSKIYVAGHNGMVGSAILRALFENGFENIILMNSKELDLRNQAATSEFFANEKPEYVFLAAAKVGGIVANNTYKAEFIYDNIMIASNVIHNSYKYGVKRLLNLGSSCIYPKMSPQPMKEEYLLTGKLEPTNEAYAIAKIAAIKLCTSYNYQYRTDFISLMPTNLYGPNDNYNLEASHVLPALIRKFHLAKAIQEENFELVLSDIASNQIGFGLDENSNYDPKYLLETLSKAGINSNSVELWGSGSPKREFLHVDDLAKACLHFMNIDNSEEIGEFLNIGTGEEISIAELASLVSDIIGFEGEIKYDSSKPDGTPLKRMDSSKANLLGWSHKIDLASGIKSVYDEYLNEIKKIN